MNLNVGHDGIYIRSRSRALPHWVVYPPRPTAIIGKIFHAARPAAKIGGELFHAALLCVRWLGLANFPTAGQPFAGASNVV